LFGSFGDSWRKDKGDRRQVNSREPLAIGLGEFSLSKDPTLWISDAFMPEFFLAWVRRAL
jgi:hypothetical protein